MPGWIRSLHFSPDPEGGGGTAAEEDAATGNAGDEPRKWAGKYDSPEELAKGYTEWRKMQGLSEVKTELVGKNGMFATYHALEQAYLDGQTISRAKSKPKPDEKPGLRPKSEDTTAADSLKLTPEKSDDADEDIPSLLAKAGLNAGDIESHFLQHGSLDDAHYKAIQKVRPGLSRAIIDSIARGIALEAKAKIDAIRAARAEMAKMLECEPDDLQAKLIVLGKSVPEDERDDIQERLNNPRQWKGAIRDILAFHAEATGSKGDRIVSGTGKPSSSAGAKDRDEYIAAIRKARKTGDIEAHRIIAETPADKAAEWSKI